MWCSLSAARLFRSHQVVFALRRRGCSGVTKRCSLPGGAAAPKSPSGVRSQAAWLLQSHQVVFAVRRRGCSGVMCC